MGQLGSKSRSLGQIANEPCICSRICTFIAIWSSYSGERPRAIMALLFSSFFLNTGEH